ncbi:MAG: biopolymer transporter ExbD [Candidatus Eiseniibacteriota bacterium]|jgi:biopolymer transport protein ExbD
MQQRSEGEEHRQTNLTPLIDVSLVLVVILLLATPLAFETSIAVRSRTADARVAETPSPDAHVELEVIGEDQIRINREVVDRTALAATLTPLLRTGAPRVVVSCADTVSHGTFVEVIDQAKLCGAIEIGVTGTSTPSVTHGNRSTGR